MNIGTRKVYTKGGNASILHMQIPKVICVDMGLNKDSLIRVDFEDNKMIVSKAEENDPSLTIRKVYENGGNKTVFHMQIPKIMGISMGLSEDSTINIDYENGKMIVSKVE